VLAFCRMESLPKPCTMWLFRVFTSCTARSPFRDHNSDLLAVLVETSIPPRFRESLGALRKPPRGTLAALVLRNHGPICFMFAVPHVQLHFPVFELEGIGPVPVERLVYANCVA